MTRKGKYKDISPQKNESVDRGVLVLITAHILLTEM